MLNPHHPAKLVKSLSARRAWIEISTVIVIFRKRNTVALRKESVDRNRALAWKLTVYPVALRKESVDRNDIRHATAARPSIVALRKESVDRNYGHHRAYLQYLCVALRKESVDRNRQCWRIASHLSSRSPQGERG